MIFLNNPQSAFKDMFDFKEMIIIFRDVDRAYGYQFGIPALYPDYSIAGDGCSGVDPEYDSFLFDLIQSFSLFRIRAWIQR